jgi:CelD/BcsL family acetyltransferase involved in cellulose biosynthesis
MIEISPLDPNGSCYDFLVAAFRKHKKHVSPYFLYGNWFLEVYQYNYQNYLESRPSQLRNTLKRKANKLKNNDLKYCVYKTPDEVNTNLESFIDLYNNSWKKPEPYPYFIPDLVNKFSKEGWVKLGMIYINSEIAASQLWFIIRNTAYIYKICQNPKFDSCSPGSLLTAYLIEHTLIHDKVIKVDFLTGDEPFKKNWMSHRNERWGLQIANPKTVIGLYHTNINIIIEIIKYLNKLFKIKTYEK